MKTENWRAYGPGDVDRCFGSIATDFADYDRQVVGVSVCRETKDMSGHVSDPRLSPAMYWQVSYLRSGEKCRNHTGKCAVLANLGDTFA